MSEIILNTSKAKTVVVDLFDYDNIPLSAVYTSATVAIDLTQYKFQFLFKERDTLRKTYTIDAGELSNSFLSKTGAGTNVLNMEAMFEDLRGLVLPGATQCRLLQVVTDPDNKTYVYIVYQIHADRY